MRHETESFASRSHRLRFPAFFAVLGTLAGGCLGQNFMPFGSVGGTVKVYVEYGEFEPDGSTTESQAFELGEDGRLSALEVIYEYPYFLSLASADWSSASDSQEIAEPPFTESVAYEWSFELRAGSEAHLSAYSQVTVDLELTEPVRVLARAENEGGYFEAHLVDYEATAGPDSSAIGGRGGTLGPDGMMFEEFTLEAGAHTLTFEVRPAQVKGTWDEANGSLWLRFEPHRCRADLNQDGVLDTGDIQWFVDLFLAGCV